MPQAIRILPGGQCGDGATTPGAIMGGSASQSFTTPFSGDAVLYIVDAAGHN